MVMDMFYSYVETQKKKRVHFHGFMLDVHKSELSQGLTRACVMFCFLSVLSSFFDNELLFQYVLILQKPNSNLYCSKGIHRLKQSMPKRKAGKMAKSYDPIAPVAEEISEEACLLCFDEFQVNVFTVSRGGVVTTIIY